MGCDCKGPKTPQELQALASWMSSCTETQLAARELVTRTGNLSQVGRLSARGLSSLAAAPLASWDVFTVCPPEGRGWVEVSSPMAFAVWAFVTSQNGVERVEYRRTGPATRDGAYIERGCTVRVWVVGVLPDVGGTNVYTANPQSGRRLGLDPATAPFDVRPRCEARFWPGSMPHELLRPTSYPIIINGDEVPNTGAGAVVGYATGYNRWASATFGRAVTWETVDSDISATAAPFSYSQTADQASFPVHPWSFVQVTGLAGPTRDGTIVFTPYPAGNTAF